MKNTLRSVFALGAGVACSIFASGCVSDYSFNSAGPGSGSSANSSSSGSGGSGNYPSPGGSGSSGSGGTGNYPGPGNNSPGSSLPIDNPPGTSSGAGASAPTGNPATSIANAISTQAVAVASRGASCLMCHANVQSDMISDFGYGNNYFMDTGYQNYAMGSFYYNEDLGSWQTATLNGNLIVPRMSFDRTQMPQIFNTLGSSAPTGAISLAQYLQSPISSDLSGAALGSSSEGNVSNYIGKPSNSPMASGVTSGHSVVEKDSVYIGAPLDSDLQGMAGFPSSVGVAQFGSSNGSNPSVSGLNVVSGSSGQYVLNNASGGKFTCYGDVMVNGTLFLVSPVIISDANGCRLYVKGSVFLQGTLKFVVGGSTIDSKDLSQSQTNNLQISSSRAIMMGFDQATTSVRMLLSAAADGTDRRDALPYAFTRAPGTNQQKHQGILAEAQNLPSSGAYAMVDAGGTLNQTVGGTYQVDCSLFGSQQSPCISYGHLLLNGPEVHSRYAGTLSGVVIGEIVIARLESLIFNYDAIFKSGIPVFPATPAQLLNISAN